MIDIYLHGGVALILVSGLVLLLSLFFKSARTRRAS